jgi:hypothetical protein
MFFAPHHDIIIGENSTDESTSAKERVLLLTSLGERLLLALFSRTSGISVKSNHAAYMSGAITIIQQTATKFSDITPRTPTANRRGDIETDGAELVAVPAL